MANTETYQQKMTSFLQQAGEIGVAAPDKWVDFFDVGVDKNGFQDARLVALTAADVGPRQAFGHETPEEKERREKEKDNAMSIVMDNIAQSTRAYKEMQNNALNYIDRRIAGLNDEIDAANQEIALREARQAVIAARLKTLLAGDQSLREQIVSTEASLAGVTQAETEAAVAIASAQEELAADAEARNNGLRDDKGRLILVDEIEGDRRGDTHTVYYVLDEETHETIPVYDLPPEEREAIRAAIRAAQNDGTEIASASVILTPEERAAVQAGIVADYKEMMALRERGEFLRTQLVELRDDLDKINEEMISLSQESEANAERIIELQAEVEQKESQVARYESVAADVERGKYKSPAELDAAMQATFGEDWTDYNNQWQSYYNNEQSREMTRFISDEQCNARQGIRGVNNNINLLRIENIPEDSPEMMSLTERLGALQQEISKAQETISMVMSGDYTADELGAIMLDRYGSTWTAWQQELIGSELVSEATPASDVPPISAASTALGTPPGSGMAVTSFNVASSGTPAAAPAADPSIPPPDVLAAAELARKNSAATMGA